MRMHSHTMAVVGTGLLVLASLGGCTADIGAGVDPKADGALADGAAKDAVGGADVDTATDTDADSGLGPDAPEIGNPGDVAVDGDVSGDIVTPDAADTDVTVDAADAADSGDVPPDVPVGWDPYCTKELFANFPPELSDPNCLDPNMLFECTATEDTTSTPARVRRITRDELVRVSGFKLTDDIGQNPFDPPAHLPYSTYDDGVTVDPVTLDLYLNVVHLPASGWAKWGSPRMSYTYAYGGGGGTMVDHCIFDDAEPDQACRDQWTLQFLEGGVLFRPPTAEEIAFVSEQLDLALAEEATTGATRQETLSFVGAAMWLSPEALFREEFGEETPDDSNRHRLTDAELGKAISYLLTDRGPGAPATHTSTGGWHLGWSNAIVGDRTPYLTDVQAAVTAGTIQQPEVIEQLVRNHFGRNDPSRPDLHVENSVGRTDRRGAYAVSTKVRDFFREWLGYQSVSSDFKDTPAATSRFTLDGFDLAPWDDLTPLNVSKSYVGTMTRQSSSSEAVFVEQMDDFIARILVEDTDVFTNLLTSRLYRIASSRPLGTCSESADCNVCTDGTCSGGPQCNSSGKCTMRCISQRCYSGVWAKERFAALPYDIVDHVESNVDPAADPRWVTMPADERAGVLTHPVWLASHGDNFEDGQSAIHRGRWIREKLFCQHVPPLSKVPPGVEIMLPDSHPDLSARDRINMATDNSFCGNCHIRMNSLGFPFEAYNHAGFVRGWDHSTDPAVIQGPVVATTSLPPAGSDGALPDPALHGASFSHPVAMVTAFASSPVAKRCFVRQSFRYFVGRDESLADACTLTKMEEAFDTKGSFVDMLVALAQSGTFRYRTRPESLTCP